METRHGFEQAYNVQLVVDADDQIIVAVEVTQEVNDKMQLVPMLDRLTKAHGPPIALTGDAGYHSVQALKAALARGVMIFMPSKNRHKAKGVVREGPPPEGLSEAEQMEWIMATPEGREIYRLRCSTAEPCFGTLKSAMGFRQFVLRGLKKVKMETRLMAAGKNFRRLNTVKIERSNRGEALFPSEMRGLATS